MKKILTLLLILFSLYAKAQKQSSIALSYGTGEGDMGVLGKSGAMSNDGKSLNIFGFNYWTEIKRNLFFETGIQLYNYSYERTYMVNNFLKENRTLNMISVPIKLRFEAGKYIFFNGGLTADISDEVAGVGAGIGLGLQVKLGKTISIYTNPQANIHALLPMEQLLAESNITFGVAYKIK